MQETKGKGKGRILTPWWTLALVFFSATEIHLGGDDAGRLVRTERLRTTDITQSEKEELLADEDYILQFGPPFTRLELLHAQSCPDAITDHVEQFLSKYGDSVRVQWSNIDSPSHLDWLDIYSPPDSSHDNFICYFFLSSSSTWQSGPKQVHLVFTERWDEMRVMFLTDDGKESFVKYDVSKDRMDHVAATRIGRYEREDMCDLPVNENVGWRDLGYP
ncbi:hypothetical protein L1049_003497 [Liquidambar formosana]|uniref:Uncharacterized protein n=1 Tax=Liquidambar formosana TaxID=63359 RepID=A0AAP0N3P5_LIQFO